MQHSPENAKTTFCLPLTATRPKLIICTFHCLITLNQFSLPTSLQITTFEGLIHFNETGEQALLIAAVTVDFFESHSFRYPTPSPPKKIKKTQSDTVIMMI